jgi:hypothetical protein
MHMKKLNGLVGGVKPLCFIDLCNDKDNDPCTFWDSCGYDFSPPCSFIDRCKIDY